MRGQPLAIGILAGGQGTRFGGVDKGWVVRDGRAQIVRVLDAVARNVGALGEGASRVLVSANRSIDRYAALDVEVVEDGVAGFPGPMAGIASLAAALRATARAPTSQPSSFLRRQESGSSMSADNPAQALDSCLRRNDEGEGTRQRVWLLTLPVDVATIPDDYASRMQHAACSTAPQAHGHPDDAPLVLVAADTDRDQPLFALYSPTALDAIERAFAAGERSIARWQHDVRPHIVHFPALRFGNLNAPTDLPPA